MSERTQRFSKFELDLQSAAHRTQRNKWRFERKLQFQNRLNNCRLNFRLSRALWFLKAFMGKLFMLRFVKEFLGTPNSETNPRFTLMLCTIECIKPLHAQANPLFMPLGDFCWFPLTASISFRHSRTISRNRQHYVGTLSKRDENPLVTTLSTWDCG